METVAFDVLQHYPPVPIPPFAQGEIRSMAAELCIDTKHGGMQAKFGLDLCLKDQSGRTGEQVITMICLFLLLNWPVFRILNSHGDKIFVRKVVIFVSMCQVVDVNRRLYSINVMVHENFVLNFELELRVLGMRGNQHFVYDIHHFHLIHVATSFCLDCDLENKILFMSQCNYQRPTQQWKFASYNQTLILKEMKDFL